MLLAWVLVIELIVAAAVPFDAARDRRARPAQVVAAAHSHVGAAAKSLGVGGRTVQLLGGTATDRLLSRVASSMGAAVDAVEAFWGVNWSRTISVVAAGSDEEFRVAAGGGPASQWADIAAVTVVDRV